MSRFMSIPAFKSADEFITAISSGVAVLAAVVVGVGVLMTFYLVVLRPMVRKPQKGDFDRARIGLGQTLVLALEFELGSDLLDTAVSPTWSHIGIVGAIVVLRSVLNFLLERDIARMEKEITPAPAVTEPAAGG